MTIFPLFIECFFVFLLHQVLSPLQLGTERCISGRLVAGNHQQEIIRREGMCFINFVLCTYGLR